LLDEGLELDVLALRVGDPALGIRLTIELIRDVEVVVVLKGGG